MPQVHFIITCLSPFLAVTWTYFNGWGFPDSSEKSLMMTMLTSSESFLHWSTPCENKSSSGKDWNWVAWHPEVCDAVHKIPENLFRPELLWGRRFHPQSLSMSASCHKSLQVPSVEDCTLGGPANAMITIVHLLITIDVLESQLTGFWSWLHICWSQLLHSWSQLTDIMITIVNLPWTYQFCVHLHLMRFQWVKTFMMCITAEGTPTHTCTSRNWWYQVRPWVTTTVKKIWRIDKTVPLPSWFDQVFLKHVCLNFALMEGIGFPKTCFPVKWHQPLSSGHIIHVFSFWRWGGPVGPSGSSSSSASSCSSVGEQISPNLSIAKEGLQVMINLPPGTSGFHWDCSGDFGSGKERTGCTQTFLTLHKQQLLVKCMLTNWHSESIRTENLNVAPTEGTPSKTTGLFTKTILFWPNLNKLDEQFFGARSNLFGCNCFVYSLTCMQENLDSRTASSPLYNWTFLRVTPCIVLYMEQEHDTNHFPPTSFPVTWTKSRGQIFPVVGE